MARRTAREEEAVEGYVMHRRLGLTFDTGALIALERRTQRIWEIYRTAMKDAVPITVPVAVIIEWWRGRNDVRERILRGVRVEPLHTALAQLAGEALAALGAASPVDAVVMASAALRGDVVYTSDVRDLERLRRYFPDVRVLAVQSRSAGRRVTQYEPGGQRAMPTGTVWSST
jgi:predicted nucleic acid-binding protein